MDQHSPLINLGFDLLLEITQHLETVQNLIRFLSTCKDCWKLRTNPSIPPKIGEFTEPYSVLFSMHKCVKHLQKYPNDIICIANQVIKFINQNIQEAQGDGVLQNAIRSHMVRFLNDGMRGAAKIRNRTLVDFFIEQGADDWDEGMDGAAKGGSMELVELFIDKGCDNWNLGADSAARGGHIQLVEYFLNKGVEVYDSTIFSACKSRNKELVLLLFEKCKEQDQYIHVNQGMEYSTPKKKEAFSSIHKELMEFWAENGADWYHALHGFANGHTEPEYIDYITSQISTSQCEPENFAVGQYIRGKPTLDAIKRLVELYPSPPKKFWNSILFQTGYSREIVQYCIDHGADNWNHAMHSATRHQRKDIVDWIILKGANDWNLCLDMAVKMANRELIDLFLDKGADNFNEVLPWSRSVEVAELLVSKGANNWNRALLTVMESSFPKDMLGLLEYFVDKGATNLNLIWGCCQKYHIENVIELQKLLRKKMLATQHMKKRPQKRSNS